MSRCEVGARPLLVQVINKVISYHRKISMRDSIITKSALIFKGNNDISPNFLSYVNKFKLNSQDLIKASKCEAKKACLKEYDNYWWSEICKSHKAISYVPFKNEPGLETYIYQINSSKQLKALSLFRLSNHNLLIEKGRHARPQIERHERFCFNCKDEIENEIHFVTKCPLYEDERKKLYIACQNNARPGILFDQIPTNEHKFIFILSNKNPLIIRCLATFIVNSF